MSISGSLSNALSGLTAAARAAEVVSSNVSNALTEGYGRRELELSSRSLAGNGAGVSVDGLRRMVDPQILGDRRLADAGLGDAASRASFFGQIEAFLGQPDDPGSLTGRLATLEASLIEAASRPDSEPRLRAVLDAANDVTGKIKSASDSVQDLRMQADRGIAGQVDALNAGLRRVADLNHEIRAQIGAGYDAAGLMDLRQQEIDELSAIVPLREVPRGKGQIALFTPGGAILVDGKAVLSCVSAVEAFDRKEITTIEGIADSELGRRVQDAFVETSAAQCGYCTAGLVVATTALLSHNPNPDKDDITEALTLHLCRCGSPPRVLRAVKRASER